MYIPCQYIEYTLRAGRGGSARRRFGLSRGDPREKVDMNIKRIDDRIARVLPVEGEVQVGAGQHDGPGPVIVDQSYFPYTPAACRSSSS